jgi:hypothetical protein
MLICMRTTLNLDDDLMRAAKDKAHTEGTTLTSVIEQALRAWLAAARQEPTVRERYEVPVTGGLGLRPGVDLDDSSALLDLMEADGTWH